MLDTASWNHLGGRWISHWNVLKCLMDMDTYKSCYWNLVMLVFMDINWVLIRLNDLSLPISVDGWNQQIDGQMKSSVDAWLRSWHQSRLINHWVTLNGWTPSGWLIKMLLSLNWNHLVVGWLMEIVGIGVWLAASGTMGPSSHWVTGSLANGTGFES